ncbi:MAG TPA: hypothetical protein VGL97_16855 [Bryobacteraceae bacterium]|jgi:hypothetical protein
MQSRAVRAELYRNKAKEARLLVETVNDVGSRATLLSVAQNYFALAAMLERANVAGDELPDLSDFKLQQCL